MVEKQLQRSRSRYRDLYDSAPVAYYSVGIGGWIKRVNKAGVKFLGYPLEELQRMKFLELYADESRAKAERLFGIFARGTSWENEEMVYQRKDGERVYGLLSVSPVKDTNGQVVESRSVVVDITERKRAEEALRASEIRYRSLFDNMLEGFAYCRMLFEDGHPQDFVYLEVNDRFEELTGLHDIVGKKVSAVIPGIRETNPELLDVYGRVSLTGKPEKFETYLPDLDMWLSIFVYCPQKEHFVAVFDVVTERKQTEQALERSEENFRRTLEDSPLGIRIVSADGETLYANRTILDIYGYASIEELKTTPREKSYTPESHAEHQVRKEKRQQGEYVPSNYGISIVRKNGEIRHLEVFRKEVLWNGETQSQVLYNDVTERKEAEEALIQSEKSYRKLAESINDVFFALNNELRYVYWNRACERLTGIAAKDALGKHFCDVFPAVHEAKRAEKEYLKAIRTKQPQRFVNEYCLGGKDFVFDVTAYPSQFGVSVFITDITERRRVERQEELSSKVLQLLNQSSEKRELLPKLLELIKEDGRFEAVGIRLREEDDFPYYETNGFPAEHVRAENRLCAVDDKGEPLRDSQGNPVLECMCGNVICGRFDPQKPFFTEGGSFWTNSTTDLLASTTEADRQARTRNRCNGEDYESVALIPLKADSTTVGLLQINDTRRNCFTLELVRYYESLAQSIGIALSQKQMGESLQASEMKYRDLYENAPVAYFSVGIDGLIRESNRAAQLLFGYSEEEFIGKPRLELYAPECAAKAVTVFEKLKSGSSIEDEELLFERKDGSKVYGLLSVTPVLDEKRHVVTTRGVVKDITERKRAEDKIRHAAEEWRATFDSITDMVSTCSRDFKLVRVNKAFADIVGMTPGEVVGKTCYALIHGADEPVQNCPHMKTLKTKKTATVEFFEPHLGVHLELSTSPLFDAKGEVLASVHVARDITARKKMQEQLIMQDRLASIGLLVSGIAHEINNPLTGVIGFSDLLLERGLPEGIKADLKIINDEAKRTASIVKNLLTFARRQSQEKQAIDIHESIQTVLRLRAHEQKVNNIQVTTHFAPDIPQVYGNASQLQQVFFNIITNAEFFMLEAHGKGTMTITTERTGDSVRASFADDGPGIPKENMRHLFNPFFTTKEVGKGTGLGLSICHGIITEHGGRIYAESEPGKGATFIVELPMVGPGERQTNETSRT